MKAKSQSEEESQGQSDGESEHSGKEIHHVVVHESQASCPLVLLTVGEFILREASILSPVMDLKRSTEEGIEESSESSGDGYDGKGCKGSKIATCEEKCHQE